MDIQLIRLDGMEKTQSIIFNPNCESCGGDAPPGKCNATMKPHSIFLDGSEGYISGTCTNCDCEMDIPFTMHPATFDEYHNEK